MPILAKIAADVQRAVKERRETGATGSTTAQMLASGGNWAVADVTCTAGPSDRPFQEQHSRVVIAVVLDGTFQYRSALGRALMTPGSLLLGNPGQCFECGHEHAEGDRCLSVWYDSEWFAQLRADAGHRGPSGFAIPRIPAVRALAALADEAAAHLTRPDDVAWEEFALDLATRTLALAGGARAGSRVPVNAEARVTRIVREIDRDPAARASLSAMAREAHLSPYHFLRTFRQLTGVTPHQYVVRARLREAARRLRAGEGKILDIVFASGFGDVSNFNRAFRSEFGASPRDYQRHQRTSGHARADEPRPRARALHRPVRERAPIQGPGWRNKS